MNFAKSKKKSLHYREKIENVNQKFQKVFE